MDYERIYEYRFRGVDQQARERVWQEIAPFVFERLGRPRRLLDPAAGLREFIEAVPAEERWAVDAVAYDVPAARSPTKLIVADVMEAELPRAYFDGIFVSNFLEHLPSQEAVAMFLERMFESAAPGGRIAVMGPNFRHCVDVYFDCADHTLALTHVAVEEHLYAAGFALETSASRFLPYSFRGRLPASRRLTRLYLGTPALWRIFGQQFLVIARRP